MSETKKTAKNTETFRTALEMRTHIVLSALACAQDQEWQETSLLDIARVADISMAELVEVIEDKNDILVFLGRMIDRAVAENVCVVEGGEASARDRLFDILMDRYDALNDYRGGIIAILSSFKYDPKQAVISLPHVCKSMTLMIEMAGMNTSGIGGAVKIVGVSGIYLKVLKVWIDDDSADLSKVMAALDKHLERAEQAAHSFGF